MKKEDFMREILVGRRKLTIFDIRLLEKKGIARIQKLPFSIKILVENLLRKLDGNVVREADLLNIAGWKGRYDTPVEIPFHPSRVLMQDFTGVPAIVDLAAMRDAVRDLKKDPDLVNPLVPTELVIDHSVQVDYFGTLNAIHQNVAKEYERNRERYAFLKWAQKSFRNLKVVPPNSGICHQVNLEYLGRVVMTEKYKLQTIAYPDTLVGTDSHTTMINGIGVLGWGVGGIEAEGVMLGQPYYMTIPEVIGVRLLGMLKEGVTATDLVLMITELLRKKGVVDAFVEYFGPGIKTLTVPERATIANMTPESGATVSFFPIDEKTIDYLMLTNRAEKAGVAEAYSRELGLFYVEADTPDYTEVLEIDLSSVRRSVAGPSRPQDRIEIADLKRTFAGILGCRYDRDTDLAQLSHFHHESGTQTVRASTCRPVSRRMHEVDLNGKKDRIGDGSIVIAAITSCTNTSNPDLLVGAGLLAKKAVERGLRVPPSVKTSLVPGSKVVKLYLDDSGLMPYLEALGFHVAGFGCTTCIGNSGPLHAEIEKVISDQDLTVAAILSGNRNFEARIHQSVRANFLASPMLVVGFAIAGRIDIDMTTEPVGVDPNGNPVYLDEIWPGKDEVREIVGKNLKRVFYKKEYGRIFEGDEFWKTLDVKESKTYLWDNESTYIKKPPYFEDFTLRPGSPSDLKKGRALVWAGESVTTDHISPAGAIPEAYPAGRYLKEENVKPSDFNSYGARRGNHEVMVRGTFGNIRLKNRLASPKEGGYTTKYPEKAQMFIFEASQAYQREGVPLLVLAGKEYGTGSSRDWAAKGISLLGVRAVIARSYERIHRSNLVGTGVLPLMFLENETPEKIGLDGSEEYYISDIKEMKPRKRLTVKAIKEDGKEIRFETIARLDTVVEVEYFLNRGILPFVLRKILTKT
ncbi:MAG: aconitate hydratase 1 [Deltaproteobacteria bacterium RBG_13_49_15]|nr:MAG: aconitate hydratase 1 [Deltaproteobacteria bacterium RBG_13_49_15]